MSEDNPFRKFLDDDTRLPSITETGFRDIFLQKMVDGDNEIFLTWISDVALRANAPVRVVADNDPDNTLFIVPPIIRGPKLPEGNQLGAVLKSYQRVLDSGLGGNVAKNYMEQQLKPHIVEREAEQGDVDVWHAILTRYGYADAVTETQTQPHVSDGVEYVEDDEW